MPDTKEILSNLNNINTGPQVNIDDVSSGFNMSPEEMAAFDEMNQSPSRGLLRQGDYFPGYNSNVAVGGYSGSEIGSTTLFAPGSALAPIGMLDARDTAIQKAAFEKAKQLDTFRRQFKAPSSKLVNINENLTEKYFGHINESWDKAVKAAKGDPYKAKYILENNPDFWAKEKSFRDFAENGNAVVYKIASIEKRVADGAVISPSLIRTKNELLASLDPSSPKFKDLSVKLRQMDADMEFSDAAQDVLKTMTADKMAEADVKDLSSPEAIKIFKKHVEELSPEMKAAGLEDLKKIYEGSSMYSPEYIEKNWKALTGWKKETKDLDIKQKTLPKGGTYDDKSVVSESGEKVVSRGNTVNSFTEHYVPANADDQKKELKFSVSKDMVSADGEPVAGGETGYVKGNIQGIGVKPFYKKENRFLTDEEVAAVKKRGVYETTDDIEMKPAVIFNVASPKKEMSDAEGNVISEPGEQKTIYFSTDKIAGIFSEADKKGKDYESMRLKTEEYAKKANEKRVTKTTEGKKYKGIGADGMPIFE